MKIVGWWCQPESAEGIEESTNLGIYLCKPGMGLYASPKPTHVLISGPQNRAEHQCKNVVGIQILNQRADTSPLHVWSWKVTYKRASTLLGWRFESSQHTIFWS